MRRDWSWKGSSQGLQIMPRRSIYLDRLRQGLANNLLAVSVQAQGTRWRTPRGQESLLVKRSRVRNRRKGGALPGLIATTSIKQARKSQVTPRRRGTSIATVYSQVWPVSAARSIASVFAFTPFFLCLSKYSSLLATMRFTMVLAFRSSKRWCSTIFRMSETSS